MHCIQRVGAYNQNFLVLGIPYIHNVLIYRKRKIGKCDITIRVLNAFMCIIRVSSQTALQKIFCR